MRIKVRYGTDADSASLPSNKMERAMNNLIYIVGLVVIVMVVLGYFGLR